MAAFDDNSPPDEPAIEVEGVSFAFDTTPVLENISEIPDSTGKGFGGYAEIVVISFEIAMPSAIEIEGSSPCPGRKQLWNTSS